MSDDAPTHEDRVRRGAHVIAWQLARGYGITVSAPNDAQVAETLAAVATLHPEAPLHQINFVTTCAPQGEDV